MNAEIADILCGDKRLADYFESFDHCFSPDEMNALANLLANDVLRELNYRDLTISELPIEITFVLRWYIIRRINSRMVDASSSVICPRSMAEVIALLSLE